MRITTETQRSNPPVVGLIALQGGVAEHALAFRRIGLAVREVRLPGQLEGVSALVLPGGESTTLMSLLERWKLADPLVGLVEDGVPVWGTCAGAVLLSDEVSEKERGSIESRTLGLAPVKAVRNAFGRQVHSFEQTLRIEGIDGGYRGVFIRAPLLLPASPDVEVLAELPEGPVFLRFGNRWLSSFHPELTGDDRVHRLFVQESGLAAPSAL